MLYIFNYVMQMLKEKELKCQVFGELGLQRAYMGVLGLSSQWNAMAKPLVGSGGGAKAKSSEANDTLYCATEIGKYDDYSTQLAFFSN